jgi:hypothetical protein
MCIVHVFFQSREFFRRPLDRFNSAQLERGEVGSRLGECVGQTGDLSDKTLEAICFVQVCMAMSESNH